MGKRVKLWEERNKAKWNENDLERGEQRGRMRQTISIRRVIWRVSSYNPPNMKDKSSRSIFGLLSHFA